MVNESSVFEPVKIHCMFEKDRRKSAFAIAQSNRIFPRRPYVFMDTKLSLHGHIFFYKMGYVRVYMASSNMVSCITGVCV